MSGTISATEGDIGGWKIAEQKLYSGKVTMSSTANDTYLGFNAGTWGIPNSIYIGSGSQGPRFAVSGSSGYMWFSNSTIAISTSNFSAIGGNVTMSGNIKAKSGNIANWIISGYNLYSGNVTLSSINGDQYMGIGAASYSSAGIYLGSKSESGNRFSITNNISGLFWDGSNLGITTSNFTLSGGNVTANGGTIAGWTINENEISKSSFEDKSTLTIRNTPSGTWDYVGSDGYIFNAKNPSLANVVTKYFSASKEGGDTKNPFNGIDLTSSFTIDVSTDAGILKFTSSFENNNCNLVTYNGELDPKISVSAGETIYLGIDELTIDQGSAVSWQTSPYRDSLTLVMYTKSGNTIYTRSNLILMKSNYLDPLEKDDGSEPSITLARHNLFTSYTNNSEVGETLSLGMVLKNTGRIIGVGAGKPNYDTWSITMSTMTTFTSRGYA